MISLVMLHLKKVQALAVQDTAVPADLTVLVLEDLTVSEMEGAAHTEVRMAAIRSFILKAAIWMTF